ncbi:MAG: RNA polymerase sigma factor [Parcubacteria group bacterium]
MSTEKKLVARAKHNKEAFLQLYNIYYPKIFAYVLVRTKNREVTEDILQDTFIKALQALKSYEYIGKSFGAWLYRIATNEMANHWRGAKKTVAYGEDEELESVGGLSASAEEELVASEILQAQDEQQNKLLTGLKQLTVEERELIALKYFSKLACRDVARIYDTTPGNVAVRLHRVLNKLKKTVL